MVRTQGRKNDNYGTSIFCTEYNGWWSTGVLFQEWARGNRYLYELMKGNIGSTRTIHRVYIF